MLSRITAHFSQSVALLNEIEKTLGKEDTLCQHLAAVMDAYQQAFTEISDGVEKGKRISSIKVTKLQ